MTRFHYTLSGTIEVPEGTVLNETGTGLVLSDGKVIKLWEAVEIDDGTDDFETLSFAEAAQMGIHYDGDMARFEEVA